MFERGKKDSPDTGREDHGQQSSWGNTDKKEPVMASSSANQSVAAIGRSIRINGDLQGEEDLRIEGEVNGTIRLNNNTVTIGQEGKIKADVYAKSVAVEGSVEGDLYGAEHISIRKSAKVQGNVISPRVSLEDGARFKGSIEMDPEAVKSALGESVHTPRANPKSANGAAAAQPAPIASSKAASASPAAVAKS